MGALNATFGIEGPKWMKMPDEFFEPLPSNFTGYRLFGEANGMYGKEPWNKGIAHSQEMKDKVTGEGNGKSKFWRITFSDGRQIEKCGLTNWCKKNGYNKGKVSEVYHKKNGRTKHKDITKVECIGE